MAKPEVISEQPISMVDLKQELAKIKERDKELGVIANKTEEYLNQFVTLDAKKLQDLKNQLEGLKISRLNGLIAGVILILLVNPVLVNLSCWLAWLFRIFKMEKGYVLLIRMVI